MPASVRPDLRIIPGGRNPASAGYIQASGNELSKTDWQDALKQFETLFSEKLAPLPRLSVQSSQIFSNKEADMPTDQELTDAKLSAVEARLETRAVELNGKIDRLTDLVSSSVLQLTTEVREVKADNKNTRWTIGITVVVTILAALAALWTTQNNLIAAFSTGLTLHEAQKPPVKPPQ